MRRTILISIAIPVLLGLGSLKSPGVTIAVLQKELAAGTRVTLVDVRSPMAFAKEHIPTAINIPASLCPHKQLPPLGRVIVYGDGLGRENIQAAAAALAAKPGIQVEILSGGFAAWENSGDMTTRPAGLRRESFNYMTYAQLKAAKPEGVVLYDLRTPAGPAAQPLTDLKGEFPSMRQAKSRIEAMQTAAVSAVIVLIDNGDGAAEQEARQLKIAGGHNYIILAGGEMILARHGQAGLQRHPAGSTVVTRPHALSGTVNQ